jgi:hypothetical protein
LHRMQAHSQLLSSLPCPHLTPLGHFSSHRQQRQSKARRGERPYAEARREAARRQRGEARGGERRRGEASAEAQRGLVRPRARPGEALRGGPARRRGGAARLGESTRGPTRRSSSCTTSLALPDGSVLMSARWRDSPQCASSFSSTLCRPGARALAARRWPRTRLRSPTR